jgi:hypothetical protein
MVRMTSQYDGNVVFKCAWNDAGYKNKCSNCPNTNPSCAQRWIHVTPLECWERHIFERWEFGVGENRHINHARPDKVAVFTTKKPFSDHKTVFGVARIRETENGRKYEAYGPYPAGWADMVLIDSKLAIEVPNSIDVIFEEFYQTRWTQGLFRYLPDDVTKRILSKVKSEMQKMGYTSELSRLDQLISLV